MKIHQLSIFLENRAGKLRQPCRVLAEAGIDIKTLTLADTKEFGILRLIVDDWENAKAALEKAGLVVKVTDVVAIQVPDRPGGLESVLAVIEESGTNVEYMYAFKTGGGKEAPIIFRFTDTDVAIEALRSKGVNIVDVFGDL